MHPGTPVPGLIILPEWVSSSEEDTLLDVLETYPWIQLTRRRVQYHGYRYDVRAASSKELYLGPLAPWLLTLAQKLYRAGLIKDCPDAALVNEYLPGQGIGHHVDDTWAFSETILILNLGSSLEMEFVRGSEIRAVFVENRSLLVMSGDSRYEWQHGIQERSFDPLPEGKTWARGRRVSITLRKIIY